MAGKHTLTRNQSQVLERLEHAQSPLSAYMLLDQLRENGFRAPLQVYRALDALIRAGLVHRLESLNAFVACAKHVHDHEHAMTAFSICDECGRVAELNDAAMGASLNRWVQATGFMAKKAVIEFRGTCANCAAEAA